MDETSSSQDNHGWAVTSNRIICIGRFNASDSELVEESFMK